MDNIQLETFRQNFFSLFHELDIVSLVVPLFEKGVMTATFVEELLQNVTNKYQQRMMFLLEIQRHSCEAWEYLLQSLIESDQSEIASKLAETYFALASANSEFSINESTHEKETKSKQQRLHFVKNIMQKVKATITFQKKKPNSTNPNGTKKEIKTLNDSYSVPLKKKDESNINSEISINLDPIKERIGDAILKSSERKLSDTQQYFKLQETLEKNLYNSHNSEENILDLSAVSGFSVPLPETVKENVQTQCCKNVNTPINILDVNAISKDDVTYIVDKTYIDIPKVNLLNRPTDLKLSDLNIEASEKLQPTFEKTVCIPSTGLHSNPEIEEEIKAIIEKTMLKTLKENISGVSESSDPILEDQVKLVKHCIKNVDIQSTALDFNLVTEKEINIINKANFDMPIENRSGTSVVSESTEIILDKPQNLKTYGIKNIDMPINVLNDNSTMEQENNNIEETNGDISKENISCTLAALESSDPNLEASKNQITNYIKNYDIPITALDINPEHENYGIKNTNVATPKENISDIPEASEYSDLILDTHQNINTNDFKSVDIPTNALDISLLTEKENANIEKTNLDTPKENISGIPETSECFALILEETQNLKTYYIQNALEFNPGQKNTNIDKNNSNIPKENVLATLEATKYSGSKETLEELHGHCVTIIDINELYLSPVAKLKISNDVEKTSFETPKGNIFNISESSESSDSFLETTQNLETCTINGDIPNAALDLNPVTKRKISSIIQKRKPTAVFFNDFEEPNIVVKEQDNSWSSNSFQFDSTPKKKQSLPSLTKKKFASGKIRSCPNSKHTSLEDIQTESDKSHPPHCSGLRNIFRKISQSSKNKTRKLNKSHSVDELDLSISEDNNIKLAENNSTPDQGNKSEIFAECSI